MAVADRMLSMLTFSMLLIGCGGPAPVAPPPAAVSPRTTAAACDGPATQPDRGNPHLTTLAHDYADHPATSGPHFPVPLPPQPAVYTASWPESRAVHNLEHGYVLVYYRATGTAALPAPVVAVLAAAVPGQRKVLMAPYPDLPAGRALALAAWDVLQLCSPEVTADEARAALKAFVGAHRESPIAPEPNAG